MLIHPFTITITGRAVTKDPHAIQVSHGGDDGYVEATVNEVIEYLAGDALVQVVEPSEMTEGVDTTHCQYEITVGEPLDIVCWFDATAADAGDKFVPAVDLPPGFYVVNPAVEPAFYHGPHASVNDVASYWEQSGVEHGERIEYVATPEQHEARIAAEFQDTAL